MKPYIMLKDYKLFNVIGEGSFGQVFLTQKGNDPNYLATKRLDFQQISPDMKRFIDNEMSIMRILKHPNIIRLVDLLQSSNHYYIIIEYCNGGTLSDCIRKYGRPLPIEVVQYFMRQIVNGVKYIHSKRIIHRDLKSDNILLNYKNLADKNNMNLLSAEVKIIDFGLAKQLMPNEYTNTAVGSPINMDPLILKKYMKAGGYEKLQGYNEKADIWSLGTIFYEMLTGKPLFMVDGIVELEQKVEIGNYYLPLGLQLTKEVISFINGMLQYNGDLRLSADELSRHDFLVKNVKDFIPANLQPIQHKVSGFNLIINSKQNETIKNMFNKKDKPEWEAYLNGLLIEYKLAKEYFKENNLTKQENNANKLYLFIQNVKNQYDLGNYSYMKSLPNPITPEFIYGCSIEERNKKYLEVISKILNDKTQLETKMKSYDINALRTNNELKVDYEQNKYKLEQNYENIKKLEINYNDIWSPAPIFIIDSKECLNENVYNYNLLKIEINKIGNIKENLNLHITLKSGEAILFYKEVKISQENNYSDKWTWKISAKDWLNVDNFFFKIENSVNSYNLLSSKKPVKIKVNIGKVKGGKGITFNSALSDDKIEMIRITILPVILQGKKNLSNENNDTNIKIYPAFRGKSLATINIPNFYN